MMPSLSGVARWLLFAPLYVCAVYIGAVEGVVRGVSGARFGDGETCTVCLISSCVHKHVRQTITQAGHYYNNLIGTRGVPKPKVQAHRRFAGESIVCQPISKNKQFDEYLNNAGYNYLSADDDYYDVVCEDGSTLSHLGAVIICLTTACCDVIMSVPMKLCKVRHYVIRKSSDYTRFVCTIPQWAFGKVRNTFGTLLWREEPIAGDTAVSGLSNPDIRSWRDFRSELVAKASNHLTLHGKYLVEAVSDIVLNTAAIRPRVTDPSAGNGNMLTDCPVILDRLALFAFRTGNWFLGLRSTAEEETVFLENYHDHLQQMRDRSRNIEMDIPADEAPSLLISLSGLVKFTEISPETPRTCSSPDKTSSTAL